MLDKCVLAVSFMLEQAIVSAGMPTTRLPTDVMSWTRLNKVEQGLRRKGQGWDEGGPCVGKGLGSPFV